MKRTNSPWFTVCPKFEPQEEEMNQNRIWLQCAPLVASLCCLSAISVAGQKLVQPLTNATKWSSANPMEPEAGNWAHFY